MIRIAAVVTIVAVVLAGCEMPPTRSLPPELALRWEVSDQVYPSRVSFLAELTADGVYRRCELPPGDRYRDPGRWWYVAAEKRIYVERSGGTPASLLVTGSDSTGFCLR